MTRLPRFLIGLGLFLVLTSSVSADAGFRSITVLFSETWTGNAYRLPYISVTGSEATPIDIYLGAGARFDLVRPFLFARGALTVDPRLTFGARRYLLYSSGRVVPTQTETMFGEDENFVPGLGSSRVMSFSLASPVGLEIAVTEAAAITVGLSPTVLLRFRAGDAEYVTDPSELSGMSAFFYGRMRWFRPELHLAGRFDLSERVSFAIRTKASLSLLDLSNPALPWWDMMRVTGAFELSASPPFAAVFGIPETPAAAEE